jgi:hypothetical protein
MTATLPMAMDALPFVPSRGADGLAMALLPMLVAIAVMGYENRSSNAMMAMLLPVMGARHAWLILSTYATAGHQAQRTLVIFSVRMARFRLRRLAITDQLVLSLRILWTAASIARSKWIMCASGSQVGALQMCAAMG